MMLNIEKYGYGSHLAEQVRSYALGFLQGKEKEEARKNIQNGLKDLRGLVQQQQECQLSEVLHLLIKLSLISQEKVYLEWLQLLFAICEPHKSVPFEEAAKVADNAVIALSYEPSSGPQPVPLQPDCVQQQQYDVDATEFFKEDEKRELEYLQKLFKTVQRKGIPEAMTKATEIICELLLDPCFIAKTVQCRFAFILEVIKLVEIVRHPISTYYLASLFKGLLQRVLEAIDEESGVPPEAVHQTVYTLHRISRRWEHAQVSWSKEHVNVSQKEWEWAILSKAIVGLLVSPVSQLKLNGVKMLSQCCRKSQYQGGMKLSEEELRAYIEGNGILGKIYHVDNHPEVISKGREIYEFLTRKFILTPQEIEPLLRPLDKCHQNVAKAIYVAIQSLGQANLEAYEQVITRAIMSLPRASCFSEEAVQLIETLMVVAPVAEIPQNIRCIENIVSKFFGRLKKHLQERFVRLEFQLLIMGVEEGIEIDQYCVVEPLLTNLHSSLTSLMLETFARVVKNQGGKPIYRKCKQILNKSIQMLFLKAHIHLLVPSPGHENNHYSFLKFLLETYDSPRLPITYEELCDLIDRRIEFTKFIQYFDDQQQLKVIGRLIDQPQKDPSHVDNLIGVYSLLKAGIKTAMFQSIFDLFIRAHEKHEKEKLGHFIKSLHSFSFEELCLKAKDSQTELGKLSYLMLMRHVLMKADEKGFGSYLPFLYLSQSYEVDIFVINSMDVFNPIEFTLKAQSYQTIAEILTQILSQLQRQMSEVMVKIADKAMSINHLTMKVSQLAAAAKDGKQSISICLFETYQCQWFDKSQLISAGAVNDNIVVALRELFTKFTVSGRMQRSDCARLFEMATGTDEIQLSDSRIENLFSHYSENGEFLTLEEWLNFYQNSAKENPGLVIDNLKKLGYRHLFKNQSEILDECKDCGFNLLRDYIVSAPGQSIYQLLFHRYEHRQLDDQCTELLKLLPVYPRAASPQALSQIMQAQFQGDQRKWIWYGLSILKHFRALRQGSEQMGFDQMRQFCNSHCAYQEMIPFIMDSLNKDVTALANSQQSSVPLELVKSTFELEVFFIRDYFKEQQLLQVHGLIDLDTEAYESVAQGQDGVGLEFISYADILRVVWSLEKDIERDSMFWVKALEDLLTIYLNWRLSGGRDSSFTVHQGLIFHPLKEVRKLFNNFNYSLSGLESTIRQEYYGLLVLKEKPYGAEYLHIIDQLVKSEPSHSGVSQRVAQSIKDSIENRAKCPTKVTDEILIGELTVLNSVITEDPTISIEQPEDWLKQLFSQPHSDQVSLNAYRLSSRLCSTKFNLRILCSLMEGIQLNRNSAARTQQPKMGLFNLGATCYINSTLQQLFMIDPFRRAILQLNLNSGPQLFLHHFQYLMYQLAFGSRQFFIPEQFCLSYTDSANQPINVREQQDADEFLNGLFDRLEKTVRGSESEDCSHMIRDNFCGQLINMITCQSCFTVRSRVEDFYMLSLEIKNFKCLSECFDKLTEPEIITDYFCEQCDRKVDSIEKKIRIQSLPPYLFIHFQRLVFDLESLSKLKLKHPVEYPLTLDLAEYFLEDLSLNQQISAEYTLRGFVVHVGTSNSGHYYSLIKDGDRWIKFDDSRVEEWTWQNSSQDKDNAYLLIYSNADTVAMPPLLAGGNKQLMEQVKQDNSLLIQETLFLQTAFSTHLIETLLKIKIPIEFLDCVPNNIWQPFHPHHLHLPAAVREELQLAHQAILQYLKLSGQVKTAGPSSTECNLEHVKACINYLLVILHMYPSLQMQTLQMLMPTNEKTGCLQKDEIGKMLTHPEKIFRHAYSLIFSKLMSIMVCDVPHSLLVPAPKSTQAHYSQEILAYLMSSLHQLGRNISKIDSMVEFMLLMAQIPLCVSYFNAHKLAPKLVHLLCQDDSPLNNQFPEYKFHPSRKTPSINLITRTICALVRAMPPEQMHHELYVKAFGGSKWYRELYKEQYEHTQINQVMARASLENKGVTDDLLEFVIKHLNRCSHSDKQILAYVDLVGRTLKIEDSLAIYRLERVLGVPQLFVEPGPVNQSRYCKYWMNSHHQADEILLPMLQLLFINRYEVTYFTIGGMLVLLRLMHGSALALEHMRKMPSIDPYETVQEWLTVQLKKGLEEEDKFLEELDKDECLNQIADLLGQMDEMIDQNIQRTKLFSLTGQIIQKQTSKLISAEYYSIETCLLEDSKGKQVIKYTLQFGALVRRAKVIFLNSDYSYSHYFEAGTYHICIPGSSAGEGQSVPHVQILESKEPVQEEPVVEQVQANDGEVGGAGHQFECPFCGGVTETFTARCPSCGEEWGQIM